MKKIENIAYAIEDSFVDYLQIVAKNGNKPFHFDNKIGWVKTFPTVWSNLIFYTNFDYSQIDYQISQVASKMENGELPKDWLIGPRSLPIDLGDYLEKHNIKKQYSMSGMAIDITKMGRTVTMPDTMRIEIVDTKSKLELWADIVSKALWRNEPFEASLFESLINNPDYRFYLAYLGEEPVATSMVMLTSGVAEINMVSTIQEYQGRGIGTAMTITPLLYAKDKNYTIGVLQASNAGEPVYRKIGFEEYCRFHVYRYQ